MTTAVSDVDLDYLKISPEVAWYLESRGIPLPTCPPAFKTPEPRNVPGAAFDGERVDKVLNAFKALRHTQGRWAGQPLIPDPWQVAYIIAPVFGWVRPDIDNPGTFVRIIRRLFIEVPRKNGKSTISGGLGLYLTGGDGEEGAQVVIGATTKDQAGFTFAPIKGLVKKSPALKGKFKTVGSKILHPRTESYMQAIANVADAQHGANIHGGIIDELHVHKTPDMVDAIESGTGSRSQPLVVIITTADENTQGSVYDERRTKIEKICNGDIIEPSQYGVVWCAEADDDPFLEETWIKANPGYGQSPTRAFMRDAAESAKNSPTERARFMRLHLGVRISQTVKWLPLHAFDVTRQIVDDEEWAGQIGRCGLDLSSTTDFTAYVVKGHSRGTGIIRMLAWLPEDRVYELEKRLGVPLEKWIKEGWLRTTEGNVVDYAKVREDIAADAEKLGYEIGSMGYDPWNATETVTELENSGVQMVPCQQTYGKLSAPAKSIEHQIIGSKAEEGRILVRTGSNPLLRWMVDCVDVRQDENGNIKPVKPNRHKALKRIDGVVAWIMAEREDMATDEGSAGDDYVRSLLTICPACAHSNAKTATICGGCNIALTQAS